MFAAEAASELEKIFAFTQNYIKMVDVGIDEMERDHDLRESMRNGASLDDKFNAW